MGTLRWEKENEERRARLASQTSAELRKRKAALALAETNAQLETLARARAIQEVELEQLTGTAAEEAERHAGHAEEHLRRRQGDHRTAPPTDDREGA